MFSISKVDGCNKMICSRCGVFFCWMCLQVISGYQHFYDSPMCGDILAANINDDLDHDFEPGFSEEASQLEKILYEKALLNSIRCPRCLDLNTRYNDINLIKCGKC